MMAILRIWFLKEVVEMRLAGVEDRRQQVWRIPPSALRH
jgi:hypothetical protein